MTDTTDIKALREASEIGESSDYMTWPKVDPAKLKRVLDQLEAERQRADELQSEQKQHDAQIEQMEGKIQLLTIGFRLKTKHCKKAEEELAALKGDQVPAAWSVGGLLTFHKNLAESRGSEDNLLIEPLYRHPIITGIDENHYDPELEPGLYVAEIMTKGGAACINGRFTAPQKPVVPVGFLFIVEATGQVIYSCADISIKGAQLIGQIYGDAAIEAAGGVVRDGE